jgi:hypothetical protein
MAFTINLDEAASAALQELKSGTGLESAELFSAGLSLALWAFRQQKQRRAVATLDEQDCTYKVLDLKAVGLVPVSITAQEETGSASSQAA